MIRLTDEQMLQVLTWLRGEHGSLQVAHVVLAAQVGAARSISEIAKIVGCSRATVRACLQRAGQGVADSAG